MNKNYFLTYLVLLTITGLTGCDLFRVTKPNKDKEIVFLAINDVYNIEGVDERNSGGLARVRSLRKQLEEEYGTVFLIHAGDFLFPSPMSRLYKGEQIVDILNRLDGANHQFDPYMLVTFGNHEFDKSKNKHIGLLNARLEDSEFNWLHTNIEFSDQITTTNLIKSKVIEIDGVKVGFFSLSTDLKQPEYARIDNHYGDIARQAIKVLRKQHAQLIIAITHLQLSQDIAILNELGNDGPDIVFGGHEHQKLIRCVAQRCVHKADSDARSATIAKVTFNHQGKPIIKTENLLLNKETIVPDQQMTQAVEQWLSRYEQEYCAQKELATGCLSEVVGKTNATLVGEEIQIRMFETNLGNFVADQMLAAFRNANLARELQPDIALINSGSIRLNQDIPKNTLITNYHLNAMFQYDVNLKLLDIDGETLNKVLNHSIEDWTGNGWWLQVAGLAFEHDPQKQTATKIHIYKNNQWVPLKPQDKLRAVVSDYIATPTMGDQDGYTMLTPNKEFDYRGSTGSYFDLKTIVKTHLKQLYGTDKGINPTLEGRICNTQKPESQCLLP